MTRTDVAVIGAGPIGLELAVALKRAAIDYAHFDAGQIGRTIAWFPRQMRFFSSPERIAIAGVPLQTADQSKCTREEYLGYLRAVAQQFDLDVATYRRVTAIARDGNGFTLRSEPTHGGPSAELHAGRVVLATGGTASPRRLGIPGEDLPHVGHLFDEPHAYFRQRVLIVGGRNSAVEAAVRCFHAGARVAISYRGHAFDPARVKYWLLPEINMLIESGRVAAHLCTVPDEIATGRVTLKRTDSGERFDVEADFVLVQIGFDADLSLCESAGVELVGPERAPRFDERTMETNVPGLYVAGTVVAGTQTKFNVFLENCHVHVERIVASLTGAPPPPTPRRYERPET